MVLTHDAFLRGTGRWLAALMTVVYAASGQNAAPPLRAKQAFDAVDVSPRPSAEQAQACVQAHAALIGIVRPEQQYLVHYRGGYCALFAALATDDATLYQRAARDFIQAVATWPFGRRELSPVGLRILPFVARMERGRMAGSYPDTQAQLSSLAGEAMCADTAVMSAAFCQALVDTARVWVSWLSGQRENWIEATHPYSLNAAIPLSPAAKAWKTWAEGQRLWSEKKAAEAEKLLEESLKSLAADNESAKPSTVTLLGPKPNLAEMYFQLARAQRDAGRLDSAITSLDEALKNRPEFSRAIFLRALARQDLGLAEPAIEDYERAIRIAQQSNDTSWTIGDAQFRRGVLRYQRKQYEQARQEFVAALGSPATDVSRADITAWRVLATVAWGDCLSASALETASRAASASFPKPDAEARVFDCRLKEAKTLDQLLDVEKSAKGLSADQTRSLRTRIGTGYADLGVAAEDKSDPAGAVAAYQKSIEYDPVNPKARFNLGAIQIDQKRFDQAEVQFRAITQAYANDHEAQFWLGESILAQNPAPARRTEACLYLMRSTAIADAEKKRQFQKALADARCPR
ncbi:MAG: tetratricopeptide repeat protein [Bryobacteraceae bacterium]